VELSAAFPVSVRHRLILVIKRYSRIRISPKAQMHWGFLTSSFALVCRECSGAVIESGLARSSVHWNNGGALIIVGLDPHDELSEALVPKLRARADWMEGQLRSQYPNIKTSDYG